MNLALLILLAIVLAVVLLLLPQVRRSAGRQLPPSGRPLPKLAAKRDAQAGIPVAETPDGKRWLEILERRCPHCKVQPANFYAGPQGGLSQNIQCVDCGWWFNVTPAVGIAEDIGFKDRRVK